MDASKGDTENVSRIIILKDDADNVSRVAILLVRRDSSLTPSDEVGTWNAGKGEAKNVFQILLFKLSVVAMSLRRKEAWLLPRSLETGPPYLLWHSTDHDSTRQFSKAKYKVVLCTEGSSRGGCHGIDDLTGFDPTTAPGFEHVQLTHLMHLQ
ncbi:hypothetical protein G7Y89_g15863 [Cudoniella acicularis]|uniref:Uncharacterized protein n=1 Tax=Cudoniella acicularis TaxID=354080 RepID=A0A8H4QER0_9HELO|nr:hypothetical protein G7Y89_g15863 [Cudoniella acicularis]